MKTRGEQSKSRWLKEMKQCGRLYWEFLKIGLFTIGGGLAMIPQIQQVVVKDKGWLTEEEMIDCIAVSQSLPGIIAINCGTYIGRKVRGMAGSIAATLGVVTPSFVIIIAVASILGSIGENAYITGAFTGIKAAVCGLILVTVVKMAKQILHNAFQWILAIVAVIAVSVFGVVAIWPVIIGAAAGIIYRCTVASGTKPVAEHSKAVPEKGAGTEHSKAGEKEADV